MRPLSFSRLLATTGGPRRTKREWLTLVTRGRCMACDEAAPDEERAVDHVIPKAKEASRCLCNCQLLCQACNNLKNTVPRDHRDDFVTDRLRSGCECRSQNCRTCAWWHNGEQVGASGDESGAVLSHSAKPFPDSGSSSLLAGVGENDGRAVGEQRLRGWGFCQLLRPL